MKFEGEKINDIIEYLRFHIKKNPNITISVGCDSVQKKRKTMYACTVMMYDSDIRNGAHVVFFRENVSKIKDNHERLHREVQIAYDVAEFLNKELCEFYIRKDVNTFQRKLYKFHLMKCSGQYDMVKPQDIEKFVNSLILTESEISMDYKLVDIHLDFNPKDSTLTNRGKSTNKSNVAYRSYVPWLRGMNFRTWAKPMSYAATSAADILLQD